ncbi:DUF5801 repeats-in-toxin domain-containing protein, partial [Altererythrobacter ishigakiensis]
PTIDVTKGDDAGVVLETQDAETEGVLTDTDSSSANFGGVFGLTSDGGADGAVSPVLSYALAVTNSTSELTSGGDAINLFLVGGVVVGSTAADAGSINDGNTIFDISVAADGTVTLNQYQQIDHTNTDPSPTETPFEDHVIALVDGKVTLTASSTITDGDGDQATDSETIDLGGNIRFADDGPSIASVSKGFGVNVDETDAGTPAGFPISDTSLAAVITYVGDFGADGAASSDSVVYTIDIVGDGSTPLATAIGDYSVSLVQTAANVITGVYNDGTEKTAFTVTINADGTVTLQQNVPLEHLIDGDNSSGEHNDTLDLTGLISATVTLTDSDGDTAEQSAGIGDQLFFSDDGPTAVDDTNSIGEDTASVGGNILTDGTDDDFGGDGQGSIQSISGFGGAGSVDGNTTGEWGTLTLNADGSYTYNLNTAAVQFLDVGETETDTFTYTIVDSDGDTSEATLVITIDGANDLPVVGTDAVAVSDEGLSAGNADTVGNPTDTTNSATATGSFSVSDADASDTSFNYLIGIPTDPLSSGGEAITWDNTTPNTLIGSTTAGEVIRITITDDPANGEADYTVLLSKPIDHSDTASEDITTLTLDVVVADGTAGTNKVDAITVTIEDDSPVNFTPVDLTDTTGALPTQDDALVNSGSATATRLINDPDNDGIGTDFIGADGFGTLTFVGGMDGVTTLQTTGGDPITAGGDIIYLFGFGTGTLTASTDQTNTDASAQVFTVTLNTGTGAGDDATYTIDFDRPLDDGSGFVFDDFSSAPAGQNDWVGLDSDLNDIDVDNNDSEDLLITPTNGTVNTSATDIGNANQWIDNGEGLRLDFVVDVRRAPGQDEKDVDGFDFDRHYDVDNASFTVMQVGGGGTDARVTITLFDDTATLPNGLAALPVAVDASSIVVKDSGGNVLILGADYDVVANVNGTVTVTGLEVGDQVSFGAVGGAFFNGVSYFNGGGGDRFALGVFGSESALSGNDLTFDFDVQATDGDGDTSTGTIDITVTPDDGSASLSLSDSGSGGASLQSFSTETNLLDDGTSGSGNGKGNGNGGSKDFFDGGTWGVGTFSSSNDSLNDQLGMRSFTTSMTATAAFGAMMVNSGEMTSFFGNASVSSSDAYTFAGMSSFEMVSMDSLGNFESAASMEWASNIETPVSVNSNGKFGNHDTFTFDGMTDLADFGANGIEAGGFSEFLADGPAFDAAPSMMGMMDASGSMMEALMALTPQAGGETQLAEMAGLDTGAHVPELAAIMDDIMAEHAIDGLLDQIAGPANEIVGMDGEIGYLGNDALAAMIDTGAFAFDGNAMADMTEEAAALATMSA